MLLIKNAKVYAPEYVGKKDLLVCGGKIECMEDKIEDFRSHVKLLMQRKEFLHRGLLISMFMLPEAVGKEAFIPVHRNFSCQNW